MNRIVPCLLLACALTSAVSPRPARAAEAKAGGEATFVKVGLLLQVQGLALRRGAPDAESTDRDLFLRRARFILLGQLNERLTFYANTDTPNLGRLGDLAPDVFLQDAFVEYDLHPALQVDVGMMPIPFSHHGLQAAAQLHLLDFHPDLLRFPAGSTKIFRDFGAVARGRVLDTHLEYRAGVFNGVHGRNALQKVSAAAEAWRQETDPRNPQDWPRLTARLAWHLFESEGGPGSLAYFYRGITLKKTADGIVSPSRMLSFGASVDWQKDLNARFAAAPRGTPASTPDDALPVRAVASREDYFAVNADIFWDLPLAEGRMGFAGQLNAFHYEHGALGADSFYNPRAAGFASYSGAGLFAETGLRYRALEPVAGLDWFEAEGGPRGDVLSLQGGLNWWWLAQSANFKLLVARTRRDGGPWGWSGTVQAQLLVL